jgi:Protein of unknown function (DUF4235)
MNAARPTRPAGAKCGNAVRSRAGDRAAGANRTCEERPASGANRHDGRVSSVLFAPLRILSGLLAGFIGKKAFQSAWSLLDREQPPDPKHRDAQWRKLIPALLLEGAIFHAVRGIVDRASRAGFSKATGSWPG